DIGLPAGLVLKLGSVPSYYLRYYYRHDEVAEEERGAPTRAEQVTGIERELLAMYTDPALDRKPELLGQRGGAFYSEAAVALLARPLIGQWDLARGLTDRLIAENARYLPWARGGGTAG